jgi:hypothetical protein
MRRAIATTAALIAAVAGLTACNKPLPNITVLAGSTTVVVSPQTYCFDASHCHVPNSHVPTVHASAGTDLFIDVPRQIADHAWSVSSGTFVNDTTFKTFVGDNYSTGAISNTHSTRVDVPYGEGTYSLVIKADLSAWVVTVKVNR